MITLFIIRLLLQIHYAENGQLSHNNNYSEVKFKR